MRERIIEALGGSTTALAIVVAIIGLTGALGGALTSYFVASKSVYISAITSQRMAWITELKKTISSLLSLLTMVRSHIRAGGIYEKKELVKHYERMNELGKLIELQLNPFGDIDRNIIDILEATYKSVSADGHDRLEELSEALLIHARWLLKGEWERVKFEARGPLGRTISYPKKWRHNRLYKEFAASDKVVRDIRSRALLVSKSDYETV